MDDTDEHLLEAGGIEQAGGDEVVGDPAGEVVAELVGADVVVDATSGADPEAGAAGGRRHRPTVSVANSAAVVSRPVRSRTTRTRLQYSA